MARYWPPIPGPPFPSLSRGTALVSTCLGCLALGILGCRQHASSAAPQGIAFAHERTVLLNPPDTALVGRVAGFADVPGGFVIGDGIRNRVHLFDSDGRLVRSIGSFGDGPGEFLQLINLCATNGRIATLDGHDGRVQYFDLSGVLLRQACFHFDRFYLTSVGMDIDTGGNLVLSVYEIAPYDDLKMRWRGDRDRAFSHSNILWRYEFGSGTLNQLDFRFASHAKMPAQVPCRDMAIRFGTDGRLWFSLECHPHIYSMIPSMAGPESGLPLLRFARSIPLNLPHSTTGHPSEAPRGRIVDIAVAPRGDALVVLTENPTSVPVSNGTFEVLKQWLNFIGSADGAVLGRSKITDSQGGGVV